MDYQYLNKMKKGELIEKFIELNTRYNKEIPELHNEIKEMEADYKRKIDNIQIQHKNDLYDIWKNNINAKYLERFIKEVISNNLKTEISTKDEYEGYCNIYSKLLFGKTIISEDSDFFHNRE